MGKRFTISFLIIIGLLTLTFFVACARQEKGAAIEAKPLKMAEAKPQKEAAPAAKTEEVKTQASTATQVTKEEKVPSGAALYEQPVKPLTPVECARCHYPIFKDLKESKSKHRFECTKCHQQFHVYNPIKKNWEEIMPKCERCHQLPHGKDFPKCLQCHENPHSPLSIPFDVLVQKRKVGKKEIIQCALCHKNEANEMNAHVSKHNEVGCQGCHAEKHGYIPNCLDCHEPHVEGQTYEDCLICHSPHNPTLIKLYPEETDNAVCGSCHTEIYENLKTHHTKHSDLYCATCHTKHGYIPKCQDCHGEPHSADLHKKFPDCLKCHIDPHKLPTLTSR